MPSPPQPVNPDQPTDWNYEATVGEVEAILSQLERGDLSLADIFEQFEAAVQHLQQCKAFLDQKQQQITPLIELLTDDFELNG